MIDFRDHIRTNLLKKNDRVLEFGPLNFPIVKKEQYPNAKYSDIRDTEGVKKLYTSNDYLESTGIKIDIDSIVDIDYVIKGDYKKTFKGVEKFDAVILGHVIEHIPDIIFFFQDVMNVLKKDGKLIIIYPDARYCFDHYRNGTTFIDAYDVYKDSKNSSKRVFDFVYNVLHENRPNYFWQDTKLSKILPKNSFKEALSAYENAQKNILPDDTHFWPFSDYQFVKFLYDMDKAGLLDLNISYFHETKENTQEFMVVLTPKTNKEVQYDKYKDIISRISPAVKVNKAREERQKLDERVAYLEKTLRATKKELEGVYNSKRWRLSTRVADIKNAVIKQKYD